MKSTTKIVAAVVGLAIAAPGFAIEVKKQVAVVATPAAAWAAIGDFCGIAAWHPAVESCALSRQDGADLRSLTLKGGGGVIVEKLVRWDKARRSYTYAILSGPLPVANYQSTIAVRQTKMGTVISWVGKFDAKGAPDDKAAAAIAGVYDGGLDSLKKKLAG